MPIDRLVRAGAVPLVAALTVNLAGPAPGAAAAAPPTVEEAIEVTATRLPEEVRIVPASITVVSAGELAARGAYDLASALALVAGVAVAPDGDGGPAGTVPEFWGLREVDAFLLVVDGVPWGGAFNPDLTSLDLRGVDRIEVLEGAAPVIYGATSFVGVVHVIHAPPGSDRLAAEAWGGRHDSGGVAVSSALPAAGSLEHSIVASAERKGFADERTEWDRVHLLYRGRLALGSGHLRFDADAVRLDQSPASPRPRQGRVLSPLVGVDVNHNPRGARLDEDRLHLVVGYEAPTSTGSWATTFALTRSERDNLRGFLREIAETPANAAGYRQEVELADVYLDVHAAFELSTKLRLVAGFDHLYGRGEQESVNSLYTVPLAGVSDEALAPSLEQGLAVETTELEDERNFSGLYAQFEWTPAPRWRLDLGLRLNRADEDREGEAEPIGEEEQGEEGEGGVAARGTTRGSGVLGLSYLAWDGGGQGELRLFADYRNTFKPAAIDFGPEAEAEILDPETAESWEIGAKGSLPGRGWRYQLSAFRMDMENLVVAQAVGGFPTLVNAGSVRLEGAEAKSVLTVAPGLAWHLAYAYHDARFRDYERLFDGVPTQLAGRRLELSARHLASTALVWAPAGGFTGALTVQSVGDRYLDKRNRALAGGYTTYGVGLGYRFGRHELRLDGDNLSDERPPVAESELGDAQYYLLPARDVRLTWLGRF